MRSRPFLADHLIGRTQRKYLTDQVNKPRARLVVPIEVTPMKRLRFFPWCFPVLLLWMTGCDSEYRAETETTSVYISTSNQPDSDLHTLVGGVDVVDDLTGEPVPNAEITIEVRGDGRVQDRFTVVTGPLGVARFEIEVASAFRPYETLSFRVRQPFYFSVNDRVPIEETGVIPDGNGFFTTLYQADVLVSLVPR